MFQHLNQHHSMQGLFQDFAPGKGGGGDASCSNIGGGEYKLHKL